MRTRALVLAGGGLVGIAWELGVLLGLREGGADVRTWHRRIGTSAGSVVGAATGTDGGLDALRSANWVSSAERLHEYLLTLDQACIEQINTLWFGDPAGPDQRVRAVIGQMALHARTNDEAGFIDAIGELVPARDWPAGLITTAVDATDGSFTTFDATSGAVLTQAVAASCAIPGVFPPVTIGDRRFVDGGVRSDASADLAAGMDFVLLISPAIADDRPGRSRQATEVDRLRADGSRVVEITPDAAAAAYLAVDPLAPAVLPRVIDAGIHLGIASAPGLN
jgi:NTE family protein